MMRVLNFCRLHGDMGVICGGPGIGKTRTARHFQEQHGGDVWIATMTPASAALVPALEVVAEAVGARETLSGARRIATAIRSHVRGAGKLLVIDESQHLAMSAIEELRQIHDATGIGIVFMGNEAAHARFANKVRAANYAQISSRVGIKTMLTKPQPKDIAELCKAWGIDDEDALDQLETLASRPGALRGVVKVLRLAFAAGATKITGDNLREPIAMLGAEV